MGVALVGSTSQKTTTTTTTKSHLDLRMIKKRKAKHLDSKGQYMIHMNISKLLVTTSMHAHKLFSGSDSNLLI